jgi:dihydrofolate synthase/folylpolyglutamate synthase
VTTPAADWRTALFARRTLGIRLSTETTEKVLDAVLPGMRHDPPFDVVLVVGTNGKGSTSAMIDHGLRTLGHGPIGLFTSPHLERVGERIRIDGQGLDDAVVEAGVERIVAAEQRVGVSLSYFEILTVLALGCFAEAGCRYVVLEAGIGGRLDSTSVVRRRAVAIAHIAFDHQHLLGHTLTAIAGEKAAVIRAGVPVFSVVQSPEAAAVIEARAVDQGSPLTVVEPLARAPVGLPGEHQRHNGALALAVVRELDPRATASVLDGVHWPGRLERAAGNLGPGALWFDVAHNLDGIEALCAGIEHLHIQPEVIVFGTMGDKPAPEMAQRLRAHGTLWWAPPAREGAYDVAGLIEPGERRFCGPEDPELLAGIRATLQAGANVLVCGSHYLVGGVRARMRDAAALVDGAEQSDPRGAPGSSST